MYKLFFDFRNGELKLGGILPSYQVITDEKMQIIELKCLVNKEVLTLRGRSLQEIAREERAHWKNQSWIKDNVEHYLFKNRLRTITNQTPEKEEELQAMGFVYCTFYKKRGTKKCKRKHTKK